MDHFSTTNCKYSRPSIYAASTPNSSEPFFLVIQIALKNQDRN